MRPIDAELLEDEILKLHDSDQTAEATAYNEAIDDVFITIGAAPTVSSDTCPSCGHHRGYHAEDCERP